MIDYGFVYMMRVPWTRMTKIGISDDVDKRQKAIDREYRKRVRLAFAVPLFWPQSIETRLHRYFKKWRLKPNKRRGSGHTEWFDLTIIQRWECRLLMVLAFLLQHTIFLVLVYIAYQMYEKYQTGA